VIRKKLGRDKFGRKPPPNKFIFCSDGEPSTLWHNPVAS